MFYAVSNDCMYFYTGLVVQVLLDPPGIKENQEDNSSTEDNEVTECTNDEFNECTDSEVLECTEGMEGMYLHLVKSDILFHLILLS